MLIEPSDIYYSQDSISKYFDRRSLHGTQTIGQTLDQVIIGYCSVSSIPTISVVRIREHGDKWFSLDNRRLWVFKQLERLGYLDTVEVRCEVFDYYRHGRKITTNNGGISIRIRGDSDPEGEGHTLPDKWYPKLQKMLERERRKDVHSHMASKTISDRPVSRHHPISVTQDNVTKPSISKPCYVKDEYAGTNVPIKRDKRTSLQQGNLFVGNSQSQCDSSLTSFRTKTTQEMPVNNSLENSSRMEQYHTPRSTPSNRHMFENYTDNSSRLPSAHSVFQRENETIPFKNQRKTGGNDDGTFSDRLSRLRVTDTPKESYRYSDISQEIYHPILNKHVVSDIRETSFDETVDGGFKTRTGYRTHSITDKTLKERETDRSGLYRDYMLTHSDKSARKGNSPKINQLYFSGYNTATKVLMPSKYPKEDLAAYEMSVNRDHALKGKAEIYGYYEHTCATDDVLKVKETHYVHARAPCVRPLSIPKQFCAAADEHGATAMVTKTDDRTSYCSPDSKAFDSSGVFGLKVRSSTRCDRNSGLTRQQFAKYVPTCTEGEVETNMSKLLNRQRFRHLLRDAWSTEAVYGSSDDSS
ncbi:uncharacterized protein LOC123564191 [Mercenaria mercenaria]|uniref:uncharacterized protein LOC123564191 n=1 Tax=Mercenaria mercenaria TaxID=6596 RepID=UPI00234ED9CD|nr:uncharacterized protein LOC123564191 [Mercenaria mercenaria]